MPLYLIILLIWVLYLRTLNYSYIIDDNVRRNGYMYEVPTTQPDPSFYNSRPTSLYRCFMIGMHCVNTWIVYMLWGWCPALLFAVHPQAVWGVAWVTGNYYATTTYFCLIAYYILHAFPNLWGALVAMPIYAAALNSTINGITFPFIYFLIGNPVGCYLFIPLAVFLGGNRFIEGIKIRDSFKADKPLKTPMTYKRLFLMTKVMGKYAMDCVLPDKIALFAPYGHRLLDKKDVYDHYEAPNKEFFVALAVLTVVGAVGLWKCPVAIIWFFLSIALHSQWRLTGQFYAQRYLYFALPGICVVLGFLIQPYPILATVVATYFAIRTFMAIPAFRNVEALFRNDYDTYPNSSQCCNSLAQYYMNTSTPEKPIPGWRINEIGSLLFKAEELEPDDWAVKMNVACFFSIMGQWPTCMQKTAECLALVKPLGGPDTPVKILEQQTKNVATIIENNQKNVVANLSQNLEVQLKGMIDMIEQQKNNTLLPISTALKNTMAILEENKPNMGYDLIMDINSKLNDLIRTVEKSHIISDPDLIAIKVNVNEMLAKKIAAINAATQQSGAIVSPEQLPIPAGK